MEGRASGFLPILAIYFEEELLLKQKPSQLLVRQFALHLKRKSSGILLIDYLSFWDRNNLGKVVFLHNLVTQTREEGIRSM
jgi:hypothetical protein